MHSNPHIACRLYSAKVYFFSALHLKLKDSNVNHDIENEYDSGKKPDFLILDGTHTVIEHKSSLPNNDEQILKEIEECYTKYSSLLRNDTTLNPKVVLAFPKTCEDRVKGLLDKVHWDVCIVIFNLNEENEELSFEKIFGEIGNTKIEEILLNGAINFPITGYSKIKFLREEPHPVYTCCQIWHMFKLMVSAMVVENYVDLEISDILENFKIFCPKWVFDREQLSRKRLKKAFEFLVKIGYAGNLTDEKVRIYYTRGNKLAGHDLGEYFAKKWEDIEENGKKKQPKEQSSLDKFLS